MLSNTPPLRLAHPAAEIFDRALRWQASKALSLWVREVLAIRISTETLRGLAGQMEETLNLFGDHPVAGPFLRGLPDDILTHPDDDYRLKHGLVRVEAQHTHRDAIGGARIGYVACPVVDGEGCLILFVANSSKEERVQLSDGELVNGWVGLVLAAWEWARVARCLRMAADDRMSRDELIFAMIVKPVRERVGALLYLGHERIDPRTDGWKISISARKSADEDITRSIRVTAGACRALRSGRWPGGSCPVGTRRELAEDGRGVLVEHRKGKLEADPAQADVVTTVLAGYANGEPKIGLAVSVALNGARDGDGKLLFPQVAALTDPDQGTETMAAAERLARHGLATSAEVEALRTALAAPFTSTSKKQAVNTARRFVNRILDGVPHLRTGVIDLVRVAPLVGQMEYLGWYPTFVVADAAEILPSAPDQFVLESELGAAHPFWTMSNQRQRRARERGYWRFTITCGTSVNLSAKTWAKVEERRERDLREFHRRPHGPRSRPCAGLEVSNTEGATLRLRCEGGSETYIVRGTVPGSDSSDWIHLHTLRCAQLHRQLGSLLLALDERVRSQPLPVLEEPGPSPDDPVELAQSELRALKKEHAYLKERLVDYVDELQQVDADALSDDIREVRRASISEARERAEQRLVALTTELIPEAEHAVEEARNPPLCTHPPVATEEVSADFSSVLAAGLGLMRAEPYGPSALTNVVRWLLDNGAGLHNLRRGDHDRQVLIDVRVRVPLADGTTEWIEAGTLDLTDRRSTSDRGTSYVDDAARRMLRDGEQPEDLAARYGWADPGVVLRRVAGWLSSRIDNRYLRAAVVTAAASSPELPTAKVVYAWVTGDDEALELQRQQHGEWIVECIRKAYLEPDASWSHGTGWVRCPVQPHRTLMQLVAETGPIRHHAVVAAMPDQFNAQRLQDDCIAGRRSFWQPPLLLNDSWLTSHACERPECPGGGGAPMTGFLPVPELLVADAAVYCEFCYVPAGGTEPLPAAYRRPWDVKVAVASLDRADGIAVLLPPEPPPSITTATLRTRDVAAMTGLPHPLIQQLALDGEIPSTMGPSGKRIYVRRQIQSRSVQHAIERARQRPRDSAARDEGSLHLDLLGASDAAHLLEVSRTFLRFLVRTGAVANLGSQHAPAFRRMDLDDLLDRVRESTGDPKATLASTLLLSDVAQRLSVSTTVVKSMVKGGVLTGVALGDTTLVLETSIESLDPRIRRALDPQYRLTTKGVARLLGLHEATVEHHCVHNGLPAVQLYPRGQRYFLREEVDAWRRQHRNGG